jgi:predicted enzyme related to lactoylglutathione lyase
MPKAASSSYQQGLVVFAKNIRRVSAFYAQTLNLTIEESSSSHELLCGHGYEVVIHSIPRKVAAQITIERPPSPRDDTPFKPTFVVPSLADVRVAVEATGGYLKPEAGAWHFRGCIVLDGWDPEGNIVQFKQREA